MAPRNWCTVCSLDVCDPWVEKVGLIWLIIANDRERERLTAIAVCALPGAGTAEDELAEGHLGFLPPKIECSQVYMVRTV
jgi:hypothetical protein